MTLEQMRQTLVEKGYSFSFADAQSKIDYPKLNAVRECSVCRGQFTDIELMYHYHPCE